MNWMKNLSVAELEEELERARRDRETMERIVSRTIPGRKRDAKEKELAGLRQVVREIEDGLAEARDRRRRTSRIIDLSDHLR